MKKAENQRAFARYVGQQSCSADTMDIKDAAHKETLISSLKKGDLLYNAKNDTFMELIWDYGTYPNHCVALSGTTIVILCYEGSVYLPVYCVKVGEL